MGKNIVICCDGTGNQYGDSNTNVVKLYRTLLLDDSSMQVAYYHPGVGTQGSPSAHGKISETFSKWMGLGFGAGLLGYVGDAYRFLMNTYEDGDRVYLFGFSRGAYTVRAISGMVHMFGLLRAGNDGLIPYIIKMFARRTRKAAGMEDHFGVASGFKQTYSRTIEIHMVGVWDTVSSVGLIWDPLKLPYTATNPIMKNGRHAVSIDERRCFFRNNLWGPVQPGQTIKQIWFPGVHSDVGGSYLPSESGLSQGALQWMLCEAVSLGLLVDPVRADRELARLPPVLPVKEPPIAPTVVPSAGCLHKSLHGFGWWFMEFIPRRTYDATTKTKSWVIPRGRRRSIPAGSMFHQSLWEKLQPGVDPNYKPTNLPEGWEDCLVAAEACAFPPLPLGYRGGSADGEGQG